MDGARLEDCVGSEPARCPRAKHLGLLIKALMVLFDMAQSGSWAEFGITAGDGQPQMCCQYQCLRNPARFRHEYNYLVDWVVK